MSPWAKTRLRYKVSQGPLLHAIKDVAQQGKEGEGKNTKGVARQGGEELRERSDRALAIAEMDAHGE